MTLARDGDIVVRYDMSLATSKWLIVIPRIVLDGLLTAIHLKLDSVPSPQTTTKTCRTPHLYIHVLDLDRAIELVIDVLRRCP